MSLPTPRPSPWMILLRHAREGRTTSRLSRALSELAKSLHHDSDSNSNERNGAEVSSQASPLVGMATRAILHEKSPRSRTVTEIPRISPPVPEPPKEKPKISRLSSTRWRKIQSSVFFGIGMLKKIERFRKWKEEIVKVLESEDIVWERSSDAASSLSDIPKSLQGNMDLYESPRLQERYKNRSNEELNTGIQLLFHCSDVNFDGKLGKEEYKRLSSSILKILMPGISEKERDEMSDSDWKEDSKGQDGLNFSMFFDAVFDLIDVWTDSTDIHEYIDFVWTMLKTIYPDWKERSAKFLEKRRIKEEQIMRRRRQSKSMTDESMPNSNASTSRSLDILPSARLPSDRLVPRIPQLSSPRSPRVVRAVPNQRRNARLFVPPSVNIELFSSVHSPRGRRGVGEELGNFSQHSPTTLSKSHDGHRYNNFFPMNAPYSRLSSLSHTHSGSDRFTLEELIASRSERRAFNLVLLSDRERNEIPTPGVYHSKISSTGEFFDSNVASSPTLPDRRIPLVSLSSLIENGLIPSSDATALDEILSPRKQSILTLLRGHPVRNNVHLQDVVDAFVDKEMSGSYPREHLGSNSNINPTEVSSFSPLSDEIENHLPVFSSHGSSPEFGPPVSHFVQYPPDDSSPRLPPLQVPNFHRRKKKKSSSHIEHSTF